MHSVHLTHPRLSRRSVLLAAGAIVVGRLPLAASAGASPARQGDDRPWPTAGWTTGTPEEVGIDPFTLADVDARAPYETPDLSAFLVVRNGLLVWERSYNGYEPGDALNVRSVTKTVTGTLVGIALRDGLFTGLEQTVGEIVPDRIPTGADPLVADVTLRQLLTMTSGLAWDNHTDWPTLIASPNWVALTLGQPVVGIPGETYVYNTGGSHLLGVMVSEVAGMPVDRFAQERLFDPLGIEPGDWARSPQEEPNGGSGLELSARDMAKLGYLYLNGGLWAGDRLLASDYAQAATTYQSVGDDTGLANYGYQWWVTSTYQGYPAYFALGYGSQHIFVVPDLDLIVVAAIERRVEPWELRAARPLIESIVAGTIPGA